MTIKIIGSIHFEAFLLWKKGAIYRRRDAKLKNNLSELSELLSLERGTTTELTAHLSFLEEKIGFFKEDLLKEKKLTKQYQEELRGTKNLIALNESEINKLKTTLKEKITDKIIYLVFNNLSFF